MDEMRNALRGALERGESVSIWYQGGSTPGRQRTVELTHVGDSEIVGIEAPDLLEKSYLLRGISRVEVATGEWFENHAAVLEDHSREPEASDLEFFRERLEVSLRERGWIVVSEAGSLAVRRYFKNGKPRKTDAASVSFVDRSSIEALDLDTGRMVSVQIPISGKERPWRIESERLSQAKTFRSIAAAVEALQTEIASMPPPIVGKV